VGDATGAELGWLGLPVGVRGVHWGRAGVAGAARGCPWGCPAGASAGGVTCRRCCGGGVSTARCRDPPEPGAVGAQGGLMVCREGCAGGEPSLTPPSPARTCEEPASNPPHVWPDDITRWPVSARCRGEAGGTAAAASAGGGGRRAGQGAAGRARDRTLTVAPLPPARRSAPTRPKPTTPASPTWTARSRAGPAASAPRAGGSRPGGTRPGLGSTLRAAACSCPSSVLSRGRGRSRTLRGWEAQWRQDRGRRGMLGGAGSEPCPQRARCLPCAQL